MSEAQNFSIASRNLAVSQSAVHRAARDLERLLGVSSVRKKQPRHPRNQSRSNVIKGDQNLPSASYAQGIYEINALQFKDVSTITVGSMPLARMTILPKSILQFNERHPDVNINVTEGPYADLLHHLRQGDIDIILGALRHPSPADDVHSGRVMGTSVVRCGS